MRKKYDYVGFLCDNLYRTAIKMKIKSVIFDLDGTLLNTLEDLADSVNYVMNEHSMPVRTVEEVRSFVGNGIYMLIKRAVPEDTSAEETDECYKEMLAYYAEHCNIKTAPYNGVNRLLDKLADCGVKAAVVTNKDKTAATELCKEKFGERLAAVIGAEDGLNLKPEPDGVFAAMKLIGANKETTVYVGDSDVDMKTAENASLPAIGVLWGFRDRNVLEAYNPFKIAENISELEKIILSSEI